MGIVKPKPKKRVGPNLTLRFHQKEYDLRPGRPAITMGRGPHNDIVVLDEKVSTKEHGRCDFRENGVVIVDWSANGTYVTKNNGHQVFLHKDALFLTGSGTISLGRKPGKSNNVIYYSLEME
ncbi:MAG: FHA domain-containing protein [Magnetococcales bacterium]|nr:FHA domain-containing protein [Magnetococcales bacterium]